MSLKDLLFNKGGIGVSLSRQETVERLNPLLRAFTALNLYYNGAIARLGEGEVAGALAEGQKVARVDVGKLAETIYSGGGVAYSGADLDPEAHRLEGDGDALLSALREHEERFHDLLAAEDAYPHQIRTQAILKVVRANSKQRLDLLEGAARRHARTARAS